MMVVLKWLGEHNANKPMSHFTPEDAQHAYDSLLVCQNCEKRATAAGRADLLADPVRHLSATRPPWDDACEDDDERSLHHPRLTNSTITGYLRDGSLMFRVCQWAGAAPERIDERCSPNQLDPFRRIALRNYTPKPSRMEHAHALTHAVVGLLDSLMAYGLQGTVLLATYCMLRRGELSGLNIGDVELPEGNESGTLYLRRVLDNNNVLHDRGKNDHAVGTKIIMSVEVTRAIRNHIDTYRSTPDPERCVACRQGIGHHRDPKTQNPHSGCDFASTAPLWVDLTTRKRLSYSTFGTVFARAVKAAGLDQEQFVPTPHTLRASGATYLLQDNVSTETVMKMGRWSDLRTVLDHYYRPLFGPQGVAARTMDPRIRAARGPSTEPQDEMDEMDECQSLQARIELLEAENKMLIAGGARAARVKLQGPKPRFSAEELCKVLPLARNETDLCKRFGMSSSMNTRARIRRIISEENLVPPWEKPRDSA